jgi:hypothetical protein
MARGHSGVIRLNGGAGVKWGFEEMLITSIPAGKRRIP